MLVDHSPHSSRYYSFLLLRCVFFSFLFFSFFFVALSGYSFHLFFLLPSFSTRCNRSTMASQGFSRGY